MAIVVVAACIGGCTSVQEDRGRHEVALMVSERGRPVDSPATADAMAALIRELAAAPLTPESSVRIALLNNPGLQATYASLGFGAAEVYEAGRMRNPILNVAALRPDGNGADEQITLGLVASLADLITRPARKKLATASFAALKQSVGAEVLAVAASAEARFYHYVSAQQVARLRQQVAKAGDLSAALAERYREAGNASVKELALQHAAASQARLDLLAAEADVEAARAALAEVLGLSSGETWSAPAALPLPLEAEDALDDLLRIARSSRLDLHAARTRLQLLADRLGVENWSRWLGGLEAGIEYERELDGEDIVGPTLAGELPIFTQHGDALLRAEAEWRIAAAELQRVLIEVDNAVRLAHANVAIAKARMREFRDVLVPQRANTVARAQEEVNYMLIGVFELIAIRQREFEALEGYLGSVRDYWIARVELGRAVGSSLPSGAALGEGTVDVEMLLQPPTPMNHSMHRMPAKTDTAPVPSGHPEHRMSSEPSRRPSPEHQHH